MTADRGQGRDRGGNYNRITVLFVSKFKKYLEITEGLFWEVVFLLVALNKLIWQKDKKKMLLGI